MTEEQVLIDYIQEYLDSGMWQYEACYLNKNDLEVIIKALEQTRWIPVSERLPETDTLVLVTVQVGNREPKVRSGYYYKGGHFHIDNGDSWEARDKELIAWMPLPEPYKIESEEV